MGKIRTTGVGVLVGALLLAACSSSSGQPSASPASTASTASTATTEEATGARFDPDAVARVTVDGPITGGAGKPVLGPAGPDLGALGYTEEEFFLSGTAGSYTSAEPLTSDGEWTVGPDSSADYTNRILVRRPTDDADFNGTVFVEWLNVSGGLDASPEWTLAHVGLIRSGAAWVGVSAQAAGISGQGGLAAALRLQNADPERYGALHHPGDSFSYDMYSQAGAAVRTQADTVLGGLTPERIIASGQSQSAFRLSTYVNALAPIQRVYDGYLIHSRADGAAPLSEAPQADVPAPSPTLVRTDLDVPVLVFSTETDLSADGLGYSAARQPDTDHVRGWEVAGTAHYDAYGLGLGDADDGSGAADAAALAALSSPPSTVYGGVISCDSPINAGPHQYVLRAAMAALDDWVRTGEPPPEMPRLELEDDRRAFVLDENGNAVGGIRNPYVDAPVAALSGLGQSGTSFCSLFGTTAPFDEAELAGRYPSHAAFVEQWDQAAGEAVDAGVLLADDAEQLRAAAAGATIGGSSR